MVTVIRVCVPIWLQEVNVLLKTELQIMEASLMNWASLLRILNLLANDHGTSNCTGGAGCGGEEVEEDGVVMQVRYQGYSLFNTECIETPRYPGTHIVSKMCSITYNMIGELNQNNLPSRRAPLVTPESCDSDALLHTISPTACTTFSMSLPR